MLDQMHSILKRAEPQLRPIVRAIHDHGVRMMFVPQEAGAFRLPKGGNRAAITIIGDDMNPAHGPNGFHLRSMRRAIRSSNWFAVVSSTPPQKVHEAAALCATARGNVFLVETRPTLETQWMQLIQKLAPGRRLCLTTVEVTPC